MFHSFTSASDLQGEENCLVSFASLFNLTLFSGSYFVSFDSLRLESSSLLALSNTEKVLPVVLSLGVKVYTHTVLLPRAKTNDKTAQTRRTLEL